MSIAPKISKYYSGRQAINRGVFAFMRKMRLKKRGYRVTGNCTSCGGFKHYR